MSYSHSLSLQSRTVELSIANMSACFDVLRPDGVFSAEEDRIVPEVDQEPTNRGFTGGESFPVLIRKIPSSMKSREWVEVDECAY